MSILQYTRAADLSSDITETPWLVESLWGDGAVGILGGEPKCCKTIMSLEIAVAIASGKPCLGRYEVSKPGRVVLYAAEDAPRIVKTRLAGIALARGVSFNDLDIQVITCERLRLDQAKDIEALDETLATLKPRLLILDPFVRLHRIDENSSSEVASVLEKLRYMQRKYNTAILVVHHAKKNAGVNRAGQALRGSSEFHAWGDSNLYMRRTGDRLSLTIEHRAAASIAGIPITLRSDGESLHLEIDDDPAPSELQPIKVLADRRIATALASSSDPMNLRTLRIASGLKTKTLCDELKNMLQAGSIQKTAAGYTLCHNSST